MIPIRKQKARSVGRGWRTSCNASVGCATGTYYMNLNVIGGITSQDPVLTLQTLYNNWRKQWLGRADHNLSTVNLPTKSLPADGITMTTARLTLRDSGTCWGVVILALIIRGMKA